MIFHELVPCSKNLLIGYWWWSHRDLYMCGYFIWICLYTLILCVRINTHTHTHTITHTNTHTHTHWITNKNKRKSIWCRRKMQGKNVYLRCSLSFSINIPFQKIIVILAKRDENTMFCLNTTWKQIFWYCKNYISDFIYIICRLAYPFADLHSCLRNLHVPWTR